MSVSGLSSARLDRMRATLQRHVERGDPPGLVALVSRRGETHVQTLGVTAIGGSEPLRRDTIFRISSMTKPVTAVAAMLLVEECKLRLDEPVDRLLPELADRQVLRRLDAPLDETVPARRPITLRDLLTFRMGMGIAFAEPDAYPITRAMSELQLGQGMPAPATPPAPDEWMRRLGTLPLMHQPGEQWMYNTGSDVLSVLIARASGQPLEAFLRERIFEPLGMKDTSFSVPADKLGRFTDSYFTDPQTGAVAVYDAARGGQWSSPPAFPSGAGGLVSTIDDYLAFGQMLLNKGRHGAGRLLSRPAVELMTSDQLTTAQKAGSESVEGFLDRQGWGFGMSVVTRHDSLAGSVGAFGWDGGMGTRWCSDPAEELVIILMTARAWNSPIPAAVGADCLTSAYQAIDD
ncbi:MAG: serine hydrolase domain-containing protein [Ktedonobacterales bacterium]|jgi:CubicO group peptidase (beta-lactamase class C family)